MKTLPYTKEFDLHEGIISTTCKICTAYDKLLEPGITHPPFIECNAIWDTGAMRSVVSNDLAKKIGLLPTGKTKVLVTDGYFSDTDFLIGMDIISLCDVAITSSKGRLKFSFQIPSVFDIDFTEFQTT